MTSKIQKARLQLAERVIEGMTTGASPTRTGARAGAYIKKLRKSVDAGEEDPKVLGKKLNQVTRIAGKVAGRRGKGKKDFDQAFNDFGQGFKKGRNEDPLEEARIALAARVYEMMQSPAPQSPRPQSPQNPPSKYRISPLSTRKANIQQSQQASQARKSAFIKSLGTPAQMRQSSVFDGATGMSTRSRPISNYKSLFHKPNVSRPMNRGTQPEDMTIPTRRQGRSSAARSRSPKFNFTRQDIFSQPSYRGKDLSTMRRPRQG